MRRVSGNTQFFRAPRKPRRTNRRLFVILLLTVILPPLGLILLWRVARCPLRGKMLITLLGVVVMVLIFSAYMARQMPSGVQVPIEAQYLSVTPAPTSAQGEANVVAPPPGDDGSAAKDATDQAEAPGEEPPPDGVIPANPAG